MAINDGMINAPDSLSPRVISEVVAKGATRDDVVIITGDKIPRTHNSASDYITRLDLQNTCILPGRKE